MTLEETGVIMDIFKAAYPQFYKGQTDEERLNANKLWALMFSDDEFTVVLAAVKAFITTDEKGFPPVIGVIKNKIADIKNPELMTEYEAWNLVKEAINNGGDGNYNFTRNCYSHEAAFEKLPRILQSLIGSPNRLREWYRMSDSTVESVVGSNFMRSYRARAKNEREYAMLPGDVKKFMSELSDGMSMPELPQPLTEFELNQRRNEIKLKLNDTENYR